MASSELFTLKEMDCSESSGGWMGIDWIGGKTLLAAEKVKAEGKSVVLVNTNEAGTLLVTNFRLIFLSKETTNIIALGTIPLATIEKFRKFERPAPQQSDKTPSRCLLQVFGKDMRIIDFDFSPCTKQRRIIFDALLSCTNPSRRHMYAFTSGTSKFKNTIPQVRLLNEYFRLLRKSSYYATISMIEKGSFTLSNELWRISGVNSKYTMCQSYPFALLVPKGIADEEVFHASKFCARGRLPVISWCHPETGAVLARSSQPLVSLIGNTGSNTDEKLVRVLSSLRGTEGKLRKLYIADAEPTTNAIANRSTMRGGGSESSSNYFQSEIVFLGIDSIHALRESLAGLREYLDTHGTTSSDGRSSYMGHDGNLSSMSASVSALGDNGWLVHVHTILVGAAWIAARIALESATVLVHCSYGWDRTSQLVSLANLLLDPYYRTFEGLQALVEKDWLAFGHQFSYSIGMTSFPLQSSPIFLQWVDCISQLLRMYPFAFEYSVDFLVDFLDCVLSGRFGNFLYNSEKERYENRVFKHCGCLWKYLADLRAPEGTSHRHYNTFYDPAKQNGPLLPPAAALVPTLWPQFHLRWVCPSESQAGEVEAQCRAMSLKLSKLQKEKDDEERKANELMTLVRFLTSELENERQCSNAETGMIGKKKG